MREKAPVPLDSIGRWQIGEHHPESITRAETERFLIACEYLAGHLIETQEWQRVVLEQVAIEAGLGDPLIEIQVGRQFDDVLATERALENCVAVLESRKLEWLGEAALGAFLQHFGLPVDGGLATRLRKLLIVQLRNAVRVALGESPGNLKVVACIPQDDQKRYQAPDRKKIELHVSWLFRAHLQKPADSIREITREYHMGYKHSPKNCVERKMESGDDCWAWDTRTIRDGIKNAATMLSIPYSK